MKKTFYGLGFNAIIICTIWSLVTLPFLVYLIIDFSGFILLILIFLLIIAIYHCLYNCLKIKFVKDRIIIPNQFAFKGTRVQYKNEIIYNEIEEVGIICPPFRTNTKGEKMKNYKHDGNHVMLFLEFKCKNNVIKNIAIWTYSPKQINKIMNEVLNRSNAKAINNYDSFKAKKSRN